MPIVHDELLFGEYSASECDSDDSNAAENPNLSYPEEDSDEDDLDDSDDDRSSISFDPYNRDGDLDAFGDFDES